MILRGHFFSQVMESETGISIFVPDKLDESKPHKVAYLLHGVRNTAGSWADKTMLPYFANHYNMTIVMPDGGRSFYMDMKFGARYYTYISQELPALTKKIFRVSTAPEDTAIIGASMGGYGALRCALKNPGQYGYCCSISGGGLYMKEMFDNLPQTEEFMRKAFGDQLLLDFRCVWGDALEWTPDLELLENAKAFPADSHKPKLYLCCGTDDAFLDANQRLAKDLPANGFPVSYEEWNGAHNWFFFNDALQRCLDFCNPQ